MTLKDVRLFGIYSAAFPLGLLRLFYFLPSQLVVSSAWLLRNLRWDRQLGDSPSSAERGDQLYRRRHLFDLPAAQAPVKTGKRLEFEVASVRKNKSERRDVYEH